MCIRFGSLERYLNDEELLKLQAKCGISSEAQPLNNKVP